MPPVRSSAKQAMHASFRTVLLRKPLDRITVRDVVEGCGLTRNTFYYHYEDIYDLFNEYLDTQMHEAWQALPEDSPWDMALPRLLDCVCAPPQVGRHVFFSRRREVLLQYIRKVVNAIIERYLGQEQIAPSAEDRELICGACCHALYGMIGAALEGPDPLALQSDLRRLTGCFEGAVRSALRYCAAEPRKEETETVGPPNETKGAKP